MLAEESVTLFPVCTSLYLDRPNVSSSRQAAPVNLPLTPLF